MATVWLNGQEVLRDWRRWGGPGHELTAGALLSQLQDCRSGVSWSIVDYFDRPKPAWYAIRRALAPLALGLALTEGGLAVWRANGTLRPFQGSFELRTWTLDGQVLATLAGLDDAKYTSPFADPDDPSDQQPLLGSGVLDGNTYEHYEEHAATIRALLG